MTAPETTHAPAPAPAPAHSIADTVYLAAHIETFDEQRPTARAVAVRGERILAVGGPEVLDAHRGPATEVVDFGAATLLPGLTDAHSHPVGGVTGLARGADLTDLTLPAVIEALRATEPLGEQGWLLGWGLDPNVFADGPMNGRVFAEALEGRPVHLRLRDAHSAVASPAALALAGIRGGETFADSSSVELGPDGTPTGLLLEAGAMGLMDPVLPRFTFEDDVEAVLDRLRQMAACGLTGAHVMDLADGTLELLEAIEERTELPLRLRLSPWCMPGTGVADWDALCSLQGRHGRRWTVEGVKFFVDGTIDNGTAWLEHPDVYGENQEPAWRDPGSYARALRYFVRAGIPTATHAIGDAGVAHALAAIEGAGDARHLVPHRIEHIETVPDELVEEFVRLGVVASMQPVHGTHHTRADRTDNWSVRLGEERAARGWRCRDLRDRGVTLALGSDWPVTPSDPRAMMADAQLRRPVERPGCAPVQPEQALTARMAHEGYTTHAAAAAGHAGHAGRVKEGHLADLTVLAANPLTLTPEQQAVNPVLATVVQGRIQHGA
ncbi:amidohydrolase [Streptomyces sp. NPDC004111]|uniref:amidohydrolase n=1 Tax=Streptomyces sp. NPDC004111 TaxID=3364690 RepID=UPI0036ADF1F7